VIPTVSSATPAWAGDPPARGAAGTAEEYVMIVT
jgi:hypothetical protein